MDLYTIYLTTKCNFNCSYCYESVQSQTHMNNEMLKNCIDHIIDQEQTDPLRIGFMGGEPLLEKTSILWAVNYIDQKFSHRKTIYYITTNALLLDKEFVDSIAKYKFDFRLSLDGTEHSHSLNRIGKDGKSHYFQILENILYLKKTNVKHSVRMTITNNTIPYIMENVEYLVKLGFLNLNLGIDVNLVLDVFNKKTFETEIIKVQKFYVKLYKQGTKISIDQFDGKFFNLMCDFGGRFSMCSAGVSNFKVMPDGSIYPCGFVTHDPHFIIGNVSSNPDVAKAKSLVASYFDSSISECDSCSVRDFCHSMKCGYMNYLQTGKINVPSNTACHVQKTLYKSAVEIILFLAKEGFAGLNDYLEYAQSQQLKFNVLGKKLLTEYQAKE